MVPSNVAGDSRGRVVVSEMLHSVLVILPSWDQKEFFYPIYVVQEGNLGNCSCVLPHGAGLFSSLCTHFPDKTKVSEQLFSLTVRCS